MRKKSELTILFIVFLLAKGMVPACASDADSQAIAGAPKTAALTAAPLTTLPTANDLTASFRLHSTRRKFIANRLNYLWYWEKEVDAERGRCGRAGDMASVIRLERDLLAIRDEIELMLRELSRVNKVISLIDCQLELK